ncbi:MAG: hypothetical protein GY925_06285 [Actinomycetia bacterium]|nr:hypothetical protein [Actinomycetes bacterium]
MGVYNPSPITLVYKFGRNNDIDKLDAPEDVWESTGTYTGQPAHTATPETMKFASGSADDTALGSGARTVEASGLDGNWVPQTVTVSMDGASDVITTETWTRLNRIKVLTAGSGGANAGLITATSTVSDDLYATVAVGKNQSQVCAWTVPGDCPTAELTHLSVAMARASGAAGSAQVTLRKRSVGGVYQVKLNYEITDSQPTPPIGEVIELVAKDDLVVRVESVSDGNTIVTASFVVVSPV